MTQGITLIVGLGNPGTEHAETRHNAGFRFLDALRKDSKGELRNESRFAGQVGKIAIADKVVWLLAPTTFMNRSGEAVLKFAHYYKLGAQDMLVVHDDLDLPPGTVRLKLGGGDGGHHGLRDVAASLAATDFVRLRIGIGHPESGDEAVAYVLRRAPPPEQELIEAAIQKAKEHIGDIVHGHYQRVMNVLHTPDLES